MSKLDLIAHGAPLVASLRSAGLEPSEEDDFDRVQARMREVGKFDSQPMMAVERNDFVRGEAFWLFLRKDGRDVASLAAKFVDLSNETLESYLRRTSRNQYDRGQDPIDFLDPMVGLLRGKMVYVGELHVNEAIRGDIKSLSKYTRLMQLLAVSHWDVDWMYGFVSDEHVRLNRLYGFSLVAREAIRWQSPQPKGRLNTHALLASSARQIRLLFDREGM